MYQHTLLTHLSFWFQSVPYKNCLYYMFSCATGTLWFSMFVIHFAAGHCVPTHRYFPLSIWTPMDCRVSGGFAPPPCVSAHFQFCTWCVPPPDRIGFLTLRHLCGETWLWLPPREVHCQRCSCLYGCPGQIILVCPGCPRRT